MTSRRTSITLLPYFTRLQSARDKDDEKNILKQLVSEELLSAEQYNQLSQLDEIEPRSIAIIIKGTKNRSRIDASSCQN